LDRAALKHVAELIEAEVKKRFAGEAINRVAVLQYGDDPVIEPGELAVRVYVSAPDARDKRDEALERFHQANREAIEKFREDLSARLPEARRL